MNPRKRELGVAATTYTPDLFNLTEGTYMTHARDPTSFVSQIDLDAGWTVGVWRTSRSLQCQTVGVLRIGRRALYSP